MGEPKTPPAVPPLLTVPPGPQLPPDLPVPAAAESRVPGPVRRTGAVPRGARLGGWPGAWVGLAVVTGWHAGFGAGPVAGAGVRAGASAILALVALLALGLERRRLDRGRVDTATRALRSRGLRPGEVVVLLLWVAAGGAAGMQGAAARHRAPWGSIGAPGPVGVDAADAGSSGGEILALVRIDRIDATREPPFWQGWVQATGGQGGWRRLARPRAASGFWAGAERGRLLVVAQTRTAGGSVTGPAPSTPWRLAIRRAYRCGPPPAPGWERIEREAGRVRSWVGARVRLAMGEEAGILAAWTLLGPVSDVPAAFTRPFRETGTMHLLSISGFHLTLLGGIFWLFARIATRGHPLSRWIALVALAAYSVLVTAPAPVLRSLGAAFILAAGPVWGRSARAWNAMGWTAAFISILEPAMPSGVSFRLSFSAMVGVLAGGLASERLFAWQTGSPAAGMARGGRCRGTGRWAGVRAALLPLARGAAAALAASLGATLLTAPWCLHHFGLLYPLGVVANLFVIPVAAVVLVAQLGGVVAAAAGAGPGFPLIEGGRAAGEGFLVLVRALAHATRGWIVAGDVELVTALACTVLGGGALLALGRWPARPSRRSTPPHPRGSPRAPGTRRPAKRPVAPTLAALLALCPVVAAGPALRAWRDRAARRAPVEVRVLDVGQGDAVLLRLGRRHWLIDCGIGSLLGGRDRLVPQLLAAGVTRLDRVWLTHGDADHWGGILDLLDSPVRFDTLGLSGRAPYPEKLGEALLASGRRLRVERHHAPWRRELPRGSRVELLHPGRDAHPEDSNEWSLAFFLEVDGEGGAQRRRLLLSGDLERPREPALLEALAGRVATVAQLAHHGSRTAGSTAWWTGVRPRLGLISVGAGNTYGLPHDEIILSAARFGARVRRTDEHGAIRISIDRTGWTVRTAPR